MEIRYLKLVKAIVDEGSLTKASEKLFLTQSALSHQLKEIESQLDTDLFYRINNKLVLTEAGKKVYQSAKDITKKVDVLKKSIDELNHGVTGTLRVCTECYTSYYWLPPVLKKFKQKYPKVSVDIKVEGTHHAIDLLLDGELEIAFTNAKKHENILEYKPLFEDEMVAVVSTDHLWAEKKFVEAEDFKSENLIIHSRPLESVIVYENLLKPNEIEPENLTVLPLTEASIQLVKANMGVIVLPSWTLMPYLDPSITTLRVTKKGFHRTHYAAYLKQTRPPFLEHFLSFMKDNIQYEKAIPN